MVATVGLAAEYRVPAAESEAHGVFCSTRLAGHGPELFVRRVFSKEGIHKSPFDPRTGARGVFSVGWTIKVARSP